MTYNVFIINQKLGTKIPHHGTIHVSPLALRNKVPLIYALCDLSTASPVIHIPQYKKKAII